MSSTQNTFRVLVLTTPGGSLDSPIGINVKATAEWVKTNPGGMISYSKALNGYDVECVVKARTPFTPDDIGGAPGTVSATLQEIATGGNATISVTGMRAGDYEADQQHGELGTYQQTYTYDNAGTDNTTNITVSA